MAQTATQRTTGSTRFRGPTIITLRGAGSKGHDAQTVGDGLDVGLSVQIPTGQAANAIQVEKPDGTVIYAVDQNGQITSGGVSVQSLKAQIVIPNASLITLHSVPVQLIAAPAAGIAVLLHNLTLQLKYGTIQFTGGGAVTPVYHGATTNLLSGTIPQATLQAAASSITSAGAEAIALALTTATGVDLLAASADFAAGDSTAIALVWYSLITLG